MQTQHNAVKVWDLPVRIFHWSLVTSFAANALIIDDDSKLHEWVGYFILALVALRVVWGLVGSRYARFSSFPPSVSGALRQTRDMFDGGQKFHTGHTPLGAWMIYNLLATILVICVSGVLMTTDMFWGVEWPEEVHETAVTWAEISILLHIAGVVLESLRSRVNLIRAMVTGIKRLPSQ